MNRLAVSQATFLFIGSIAILAVHARERQPLFPAVESYVQQRVGEFEQIPPERKSRLEEVSLYVRKQIKAGEPVRLTFLCTHNSRRSQMAQIWGATAAAYYGIEGVEAFSGGMETTAFNPRAIAAIERAGLTVKQTQDGKNPHYAVQFQETAEPLVCFSKVYREAPNPQRDYCAVMVCSHADENCPTAIGCTLRVAIPFEDPKSADGTADEEQVYDERCRQIAREILYIFSRVEKPVNELK